MVLEDEGKAFVGNLPDSQFLGVYPSANVYIRLQTFTGRLIPGEMPNLRIGEGAGCLPYHKVTAVTFRADQNGPVFLGLGMNREE
jgi:hypothetical protein